MDFTKKMPYGTDELIDLYNRTSSGHFFDRDTMRFFKSRVTGYFRRLSDTEALFITTERGPLATSKRMATVRRATIVNSTREDGALVSKFEIETVGEFNAVSLYKAKKYLNAA